MNLKKTAMTLGLAVLTIGATAASAYAATAYATGSVNVRSGPGTGYHIVDRLSRGEMVDVRDCAGSWCRVSKPGPDGWVSANYLSAGGGYNDDYNDDDYYDGHHNHYDNVYIVPRHRTHYYPRHPSASFCVGGQNASFCLNGY